uniref:hypothetical protein n=1 Tax=Salmonella sp. TaxID=599 RepID=UPI001CD996F9|nr:hypothetical protein [Salmonella sp.]
MNELPDTLKSATWQDYIMKKTAGPLNPGSRKGLASRLKAKGRRKVAEARADEAANDDYHCG